jgi:hypothetical protein
MDNAGAESMLGPTHHPQNPESNYMFCAKIENM